MTNEEALQDWFKNNYPNDSFDDHKFYLIYRGWQAAIAYMQEQNKSAENSEPVAYLKFYSHEYGLDRWEGFEEVSKNTDGAFPVYTTPQISQEQSEPVVLEAIYEIIINWDDGGGKRSRRELARRIVSYCTTPQRQQPLKRLDNYDLSEILDEYWYEPLKIALTVMDKMERINK